MICACIKQNKVVGILEFQSEQEYQDMAHEFDLMIDVQNYTSIPQIGWEYIPELDKFNYGQLNSIPSVKITKLSFRNRFTDSEKAAIKAASLQPNNLGYLLSTRMDDQRDATYIDLCRPDTIAGLQAFVSLGFIMQSRMDIILNTPPTYEEIYKG